MRSMIGDSDMRVRVAEERDADDLAQVVVTTYRGAHRDQLPQDYLLSSLTYEQSAHNWRRTLHRLHGDAAARERVFLAEDTEGRAVGVAMGGPDRGNPATDDGDTAGTGGLYLLYILPEYQRRGLGRLLIGVVAEWLMAQGLHRMRVRVLRENLPARQFYMALGGEEIGMEAHEDAGVVLHQAVYEWANVHHLLPQRFDGA